MSSDYNDTIARHYSAYRPPLHPLILGKVFGGNKRFSDGLDVGCGTGYSAIALTNYCQRVCAIDPSESMLHRATPHAQITYLKGEGASIPMPDHSTDAVTFAGSLFYAKSIALVSELKRVCRENAFVIPYDFEVVLDDILTECGINIEATPSNYNHEVNFSDTAGFAELLNVRELVSLDVSATQLAHLLLSEDRRHTAFAMKYRVSDPFPALTADLGAARRSHSIQARVYYSKYKLELRSSR